MKVKVNTRVNGASVKAVILTRKEYESLLDQIDTLNAALDASYAQEEKQFQENKDLRVREAHLQDDIKALKCRCARAEQESRDWYSKYLTLQTQSNDETCALRDALNDRNARVDELEHRNEWLEDQANIHNIERASFTRAVNDFDESRKNYEKEIARLQSEKQDWIQSAEQWRIKYEAEHKTYEEDKERADAICKNCDAIYEKILTERNDLHQKLEEANEQIEYYKTQELVFQDAEKDFKSARTYYEDLLRQKAHEQSELMEKLADANRQLAEAHKRIDEQQRIIADAGETIANQQRPKYHSLWDLLTEHGLIIDATTLPSNSANRPQE